MQLGAVGKDGRLGGRLERELGLYEEVLMQKRKGAKDRKSNKAKEDAGDVAGDEDGERGEPSSKKARRMQQADQDDDHNENGDGDEQDMLDSQLNGDGVARGVPDKVRGKKKTNHADSGSSPTATNGKAQGDETESDHEAEQDDEEDEDEDEDGQDNEDDDDNNNDEDQDDDSDDDDGNEADDVDEELEGRTAHVGLQPNGRAEIDGSDDDSD